MARTLEDLSTLSNAEIARRLRKTLKSIQTVFVVLVVLAVASVAASVFLNTSDNRIAGSAVSLLSAALIVSSVSYLRHLRKKNDALIKASIEKNKHI